MLNVTALLLVGRPLEYLGVIRDSARALLRILGVNHWCAIMFDLVPAELEKIETERFHLVPQFEAPGGRIGGHTDERLLQLFPGVTIFLLLAGQRFAVLDAVARFDRITVNTAEDLTRIAKDAILKPFAANPAVVVCSFKEPAILT